MVLTVTCTSECSMLGKLSQIVQRLQLTKQNAVCRYQHLLTADGIACSYCTDAGMMVLESFKNSRHQEHSMVAQHGCTAV